VTFADFDRTLTANYARMPVEWVRGDGTSLFDADGTEYLDFQTGLAVNALGHCHPDITKAITEQATELSHVGNLFYNAPMVRLAQRLVEHSFGERVFFTNSGTEAVEAALKCARKRKRGGKIVSVHRGFHGRTYGSLSATPQEDKQAPFAPLVPGFVAVEPTAEALAAEIDDSTAAVIIEPVQGESGVWVIGDDVLRAAREACDQHGAALIYDEVQCGLGRTGKLWGYEYSGVIPDAMTLSKALGGGLPLGALVCGPEMADVFAPGDHGSTFAGGPIQCAAANVVLDHVTDKKLLKSVTDNGERLREALAEFSQVTEVRGRGLMVAAELEGVSAPDLVKQLFAEQHLVANATGPTTLRLLPPLIVSTAEIDDAISRIKLALG
jgi:acetylornithine/N-succinyldiaminopimelate aminotransferase